MATRETNPVTMFHPALRIWPILKKEYQLGSYHWKLLITFSELNIRIYIFAVWCISRSWLHICKNKLPTFSGFLLNTCFYDKKCLFFQRKNVSFWRGVFSGNSRFNCWCIFSDIYDSPHCKRVGEQSSVWIGGFQQKILEIWPPKKISVSLHISVNFHLQH